MCESIAYLKYGETEELLLKDVIKLVPTTEGFLLTNLLGDNKEIKAEIDNIDLLHHRIVFRAK